MKLTEAIEALCVATRANARSPRTVRSYREKLGHFADFLGGDTDVSDISTHDIRCFVVSQMDAELSPFTVSTRTKAVKRLFNWLQEEHIIENNPSSRVETPTPRRETPKGTPLEDIHAMISTCGNSLAGKRDRAALMFLTDTGCRAGGLCGLEIDKLDLDNLKAVVSEKGKVRFVLFTEATAQALRDWLAVRPGEDEFVLTGIGVKSEGALTPSGLWQMVQRRAKRAGIEGPVSVHGFRHTFARLYLLDGGDLGTLSELMGHEDVSTTKRWYGVFALPELQEKHKQHSPLIQMMRRNYSAN